MGRFTRCGTSNSSAGVLELTGTVPFTTDLADEVSIAGEDADLMILW